MLYEVITDYPLPAADGPGRVAPQGGAEQGVAGERGSIAPA